MSYTPITEFHLETRQVGSPAWRAYSVPPHADGELYHSAGKLYLTKLQLATAYQARVKSSNKEGMSSWSHSFTFATRGGGEDTVWSFSFCIRMLSEPRQEQMTQAAAGNMQLLSYLVFSASFLILRCFS